MSVERLERVMWRLRRRCPGNDRPPWSELRLAIMKECGTDPKTIKVNKRALKLLGWIKVNKGNAIELTGEDLRGG